MTAKIIPITQSEVCELLDYDPQTGKFYWKPRGIRWFSPSGRRSAEHKMKHWNATFGGTEAFTSVCGSGDGYARSLFMGKFYRAHRIAWFIMTGEQPAVIDHINGDTTDNRFENLRAVTQAENCKNTRRRSDNKTGVTGVFFHKRNNNWWATMGKKRLGSFKTKEEAIAARKAAELRAGYHPNHGR